MAKTAALPTDLPILKLRSPHAFRKWLRANHEEAAGVWIRFYKKASGVQTITYEEALDEALCYGWIDSLLKRVDDTSYVQRFTPRRPKSKWSKINRDHVARLVREKRMQAAGLREVERAKADGRWDAAYDAPSKMKIPDDFAKALAKNAKAKAFFATLNRANVYAVCFRLHGAKRPETRQRHIERFIRMLANGEKLV